MRDTEFLEICRVTTLVFAGSQLCFDWVTTLLGRVTTLLGRVTTLLGRVTPLNTYKRTAKELLRNTQNNN